MTEQSESRTFATSKAAKAAGYHSRRHETREAQDTARERYQAERGREARRRRAAERTPTSKSGVPITDKLADQLADEAERGYDLKNQLREEVRRHENDLRDLADS
jgi:hypothetical protein